METRREIAEKINRELVELGSKPVNDLALAKLQGSDLWEIYCGLLSGVTYKRRFEDDNLGED